MARVPARNVALEDFENHLPRRTRDGILSDCARPEWARSGCAVSECVRSQWGRV